MQHCPACAEITPYYIRDHQSFCRKCGRTQTVASVFRKNLEATQRQSKRRRILMFTAGTLLVLVSDYRRSACVSPWCLPTPPTVGVRPYAPRSSASTPRGSRTDRWSRPLAGADYGLFEISQLRTGVMRQECTEILRQILSPDSKLAVTRKPALHSL